MRHHRQTRDADQMEAFHAAAQAQRFCAHPDCGRKTSPWHPHHVISKQELKRLGLPIDDPRNALRLCPDCHANHESSAGRRLPMCALTDENIEYAFESLGQRAYYYLHRHYAGDDARVQAAYDWLDEYEEVL